MGPLNTTSFQTSINTRVNSYHHPSPSELGEHSAKTTAGPKSLDCTRIFANSDDTGAMEMTACIGAGLVNNKSMFKNWSTDTTRVFDTSSMEMTQVVGQEDKLSSELKSALKEVVADRTRMFSGDEETAEMEFTACLTNTVNQIQVNQNSNQRQQCGDAPTPVVAGSMPSSKQDDIPTCNPTLVDSQAFLQKMGFGTHAEEPQMSVNTAQKMGKLDMLTKVQESPSVKIDAQSFLSKMMQSKPQVEKEEAKMKASPVRDGTFTQGSDEMEFTACLSNTTFQGVQNIGPTQSKMSLALDTTLTYDAASRISPTPNNEGDDSVVSFKPNATIMLPQGEDMEFTTCMAGIQNVSEKNVTTSTKANTTVHFDSDMSGQMEFTACVDVVSRPAPSEQPNVPIKNVSQVEVTSGEGNKSIDLIAHSSQGDNHIPDTGTNQVSLTRDGDDQMEFTACMTTNIMGPKLDPVKSMNDQASVSVVNSPDNKRTKLNNRQSLGNKTILFESGSAPITGNMELTMCTGNISSGISPTHSPVAHTAQTQSERKDTKNPRKRTSSEMRQESSQPISEITSNLNVTKYFGGEEKTDAMDLTTFHSKILEVRDDNNQEVKFISEEIEPEIPDSLPPSPEYEGTASLRYHLHFLTK